MKSPLIIMVRHLISAYSQCYGKSYTLVTEKRKQITGWCLSFRVKDMEYRDCKWLKAEESKIDNRI
ncbi:hypothetical protein D9754_09810 [Planomicrobium sp. Y74]|nr:hypothetical protein D9754_09810 [Planomicrobium sp. Y74]